MLGKGHSVNNSRPTQCQTLLAELLAGKRYTQLKALKELGIGRLTSRIYELRCQGYGIKDQMVPVINQFGEKVYVKEYWIDG